MPDLKKIKCECGHVNPLGTELCESCGNPFSDDSNDVLNMRYEGVARRSQVYTTSIVDQVWNFFASVKIAVWIIAITLVASIFGTLLPQQMYIPSNANPYIYYPEHYGFFGYLYVAFGLHNMYSSWWFVSLLVMIGISLIVCSVDRAVPLYRALNTQQVTRHPRYISRLRLFGKATSDDVPEDLEKAKKVLKQKRYHIREADHAIMGEKGRFSRWGPYINHIGLIIFLIGVLMRILPGFALDTYVWVRDNETVPVTGTGSQYFIKNEGFYLETYDEASAIVPVDRMLFREFRTDAVLFERIVNEETGAEELLEVMRHSILVNDPLVYKQLRLYQADYVPNEFKDFTFSVTHKETGESLGQLTINLRDPIPHYSLENGYAVELIGYYPDFDFDHHNQPTTKSSFALNPGFIFKLITPDIPEGVRSLVLLGQTIEIPGQDSPYAFRMVDLSFHNVSGLLIRKDVSLPVIYAGLFISFIGLSMGFYWQHRRIWLQKEGNELWLGAHTNKNWFGLNKEVEDLIDKTGIPIDKSSIDKEDKE